MAQKEVFVTAEGLERLKAELEHLRSVRRQEVADKIQRAIERGSTVNNAEFDDAKNEQAFVEGRVLTLEKMIKNSVVISTEEAPSEQVKLGSRVTVRSQDGSEEYYTIIGSAEADPGQGKISNESPVGRAILGKKVGEEVEIQAPGGAVRLRVIEVK